MAESAVRLRRAEAALEDQMSRRIAFGALIAVLSFSTVAAAQERRPVHHHRHVWRASGDIVVHAAPPYYPVGFVSNGTNVEEGGANGLSGDDSYGPPLGFHGGLSRNGVVAPGPGGPFDRVSGCGSENPC
jgi:hypothetical protein